jgi:hypothetical protein
LENEDILLLIHAWVLRHADSNQTYVLHAASLLKQTCVVFRDVARRALIAIPPAMYIQAVLTEMPDHLMFETLLDCIGLKRKRPQGPKNESAGTEGRERVPEPPSRPEVKAEALAVVRRYVDEVSHGLFDTRYFCWEYTECTHVGCVNMPSLGYICGYDRMGETDIPECSSIPFCSTCASRFTNARCLDNTSRVVYDYDDYDGFVETPYYDSDDEVYRRYGYDAPLLLIIPEHMYPEHTSFAETATWFDDDDAKAKDDDDDLIRRFAFLSQMVQYWTSKSMRKKWVDGADVRLSNTVQNMHYIHTEAMRLVWDAIP